MAKSNDTFNKREKEKQRRIEKQDKQAKMTERKLSQTKGKSLEEMMAYVDENGNLTSVPPDPRKKKIYNVEDIEIGVQKSSDFEDPNKTGRIDYYNSEKGFGFIIQNDGEKIFFHVNQVSYNISEGDRVNYTVEKGPKGFSAIGVTMKN